jgi:PAS domain S-box-containing protein
VNEAQYLQTIYQVSDTERIRIYGLDITERKRAERELQKINRTLRAINNSNETLLRATDETTLLQDVCRIVTEDCGYAMVWVGYADEDEHKTVRPVAHSGYEEGYLKTVRVTWADTERGRGPAGTAIRTGQACICGNMLDDPRFAPWQEEARKRGYASSLGVPLLMDGKSFGVITIYSREPDAFAKEEVELLTELAGDLGYGISALRTRAAREQAERALRGSENRFRSMYEHAAVGIEQVGLDGRLLMVNEALCRMLGYSEAELLSKTFEEITHPDDHAREAELLEKMLQGEGGHMEIEKRYVHRNGALVWVAVTSSCVRDDAGHPLYRISIIQNITERKRSEARLAADFAALTRMHSLSERALGAFGVQPLLQEAMDAAVAIVGAERGTLQLLEGDSLRIVAHHGHKQPFLDFFAAAESRASVCGEASQRAERVVVQDVENSTLFAGTPSLPVLRQAGVRAVQSTPLLSRTGTLLGILTTQWSVPYTPDKHDLWRIDVLARQAADMIEHAKAEQAVRQSRERLAAVVDSAMDAIITVDQEQRIVMFNAAAEKTFGRDASQAIGQPLDQFIPEQFRQSHRQHVRQFGEGGATSRTMHSPAALYGLRADGTEFPIEATISQVEAGGQKLYTVILRDITLRKQTEETLMRSEKLATVGRLAATIAHEINNPLGAVTNILFLLKNDASITPASRQFVDMAEVELQRAVQIASTTLGLSKQAAQPVKFRPAELLDGVLALVSRKQREGVKIETDNRATQLEIFGVAGEIRQVLWNLIGNALDASPEQGRIVARVRDSADWRRLTVRGARFTIADTGCGMTRDALQHIFEPFFTTKDTGTGLGLWVTSEIIQKHGGSIKVRSRKGETQHGTVFSVFIPSDGQHIQQSTTTTGDDSTNPSAV